MLSNVGEKVVNVSPDVSARGLDAGDDLREYFSKKHEPNTDLPYLRNHF